MPFGTTNLRRPDSAGVSGPNRFRTPRCNSIDRGDMIFLDLLHWTGNSPVSQENNTQIVLNALSSHFR